MSAKILQFPNALTYNPPADGWTWVVDKWVKAAEPVLIKEPDGSFTFDGHYYLKKTVNPYSPKKKP